MQTRGPITYLRWQMGTSPLHATRLPDISHRLLDCPINLCLVLKGLNIHPKSLQFESLSPPDRLGRCDQQNCGRGEVPLLALPDQFIVYTCIHTIGNTICVI